MPAGAIWDSHRSVPDDRFQAKIITRRSHNLTETQTMGGGHHIRRCWRWGFITNSHCTHYMAQNDSTRQYQPQESGTPFFGNTATDANDAGTEVLDPGWDTCRYVHSFPCRWSDSAFHALPPWLDPDRSSGAGRSWQYWDRHWSHGTIALPSQMGAINYDGWYTAPNGFPIGARWIKAVSYYPLEGEGVHKVGNALFSPMGAIEADLGKLYVCRTGYARPIARVELIATTDGPQNGRADGPGAAGPIAAATCA